MPERDKKGERSWEHSLACAWHDGERCTCKEDDENPNYGPGNPDWEHDRKREGAA